MAAKRTRSLILYTRVDSNWTFFLGSSERLTSHQKSFFSFWCVWTVWTGIVDVKENQTMPQSMIYGF